jgi:hypothetical protein
MSIYEQIQRLPKELQVLISEYNVDHRTKMNRVLNEILGCLMCGESNVHNRERIYLDYDIDDNIGICCNIDCQLELSLYNKYFYKSHPGYVPAKHR